MIEPAVSQLLYLLDDAFAGTKWHSLLGNLESVTDDDWLWVPPDGRRSIQEIVRHVGGGKLLYHNHAFGDATIHWDDPIAEDPEATVTKDLAIAWLQARHDQWRQAVAGLTDAELFQPRKNFRGELKETRWLINVMIAHDLYHSGEINHIRALHQGDDY